MAVALQTHQSFLCPRAPISAKQRQLMPLAQLQARQYQGVLLHPRVALSRLCFTVSDLNVCFMGLVEPPMYGI